MGRGHAPSHHVERGMTQQGGVYAPPHRVFSVVLLFILWDAGVEGGGGGACRMLPLVTKWEITHVTGHGAGNPKPMPQVQVFWRYGISNLYLYSRETYDIPYSSFHKE